MDKTQLQRHEEGYERGSFGNKTIFSDGK